MTCFSDFEKDVKIFFCIMLLAFQIESSRVQLNLFSNFVGDFVAISVHSVDRALKESSGNLQTLQSSL